MKFIFIDRDGVINKDPGGWTENGYVTSWQDFHFLPGSLGAIRKLTESGYEIIVISNQAAVNRGLFTMEDLNKITKSMLNQIGKNGGRIHSIFYCPHRTDENCGCRKPKAGLFKKATEGMNVDFKNTYFIGDGVMDVEAGENIGCRTILLLSGKTRLENVNSWSVRPDFIKKDLKEAVGWILSKERK